MNFLYYSKSLEYPSEEGYSPSVCYPEYKYTSSISKEPNRVYESIRKIFLELGLDEKHYGSADWNPLGAWINPGDHVVLKPNFVMHRNGSNNPDDLDSLVTHPSIIRCMLDYAFIALKGKGQVIVGDAPVKDCDFEKLMDKRDYTSVINFYKSQGIAIECVDFRGEEEEGKACNKKGKGICVNLGERSAFYECGHDESRYRIPNYNKKSVISHHKGMKQEYMLNSIILDADVIINLPKPKSHRKAGYTAAMKNFVGANYSKEYLPHHTEGDVISGGDEYKRSGFYRRRLSSIRNHIDVLRCKVDRLEENEQSLKVKIYNKERFYLWKIYEWLMRKDDEKNIHQELAQQAREGSWYGNDTLWRTIFDINQCVIYADKQGKIQKMPQRKIITMGDMIISGDGEGPLAPSPKEQHMLLFSDNIISFDAIVVNIMGFNYKRFKGLYKALKDNRLRKEEYNKIKILSNDKIICGRRLSDVYLSNLEGAFKATSGWINYIGEADK